MKTFVRQRLLSSNIFNIAAKPKFIAKILKVAYPSENNVDEELINILFKPTQSKGAPEAFRGFINLFDDYLAPNLLKEMNTSVYLIWGEKDPWEPVKEAQKWFKTFECIKSLDVISDAGHCPHDEMPEKVKHGTYILKRGRLACLAAAWSSTASRPNRQSGISAYRPSTSNTPGPERHAP